MTSPNSPFHLRGNDFDAYGIARWFKEEVAYHDAFEGGRSDEYPFFYHYYNWIFGLKALLKPGVKVLDFGCAEGLTLSRAGTPVEYHGVDVSTSLLNYARKRNPTGDFKLMGEDQRIPYPDASFDLILCFGVLHHIPNVSFVLKELRRVLKPGGHALIREPITDMCKMDGTRAELSPNERGIHPVFFQQVESQTGMKLIKTNLCFFGPLNQIRQRALNYPILVRFVIQLDRMISNFYSPNATVYRRRNFFEKCAPNSAYFLLEAKN